MNISCFIAFVNNVTLYRMNLIYSIITEQQNVTFFSPHELQ